jgi:hypothetical protein
VKAENVNDVVKVKEAMLTSWFVTYGLVYNPIKFRRVTNGRKFSLNKPDGGLWSSPLKSVFGWKDWCEAEGYIQRYGFSCGFKFKLKSRSRIYVIDSLQDFQDLLRLYSRRNLMGDRCIDWERLSKDYDGCFLTLPGLDQTRLGAEGLGMYSWDCESLVIFDLNVLSVVKSLRRCEL